MRTKLVAANWKMHKTLRDSKEFVGVLLSQIKNTPEIEVALAPPFTALATVGETLKGSRVRLAAQNMHFGGQGAYTGEISPAMLRDVACTYVILGHSERRQHFGEDDDLINRKLVAAFENQLIPILCVGESFQERHAQATEKALERQLRADLKTIAVEQASRLVIAYEPVWAIGTGETASPTDAEQGARFLRELVGLLYGSKIAESVRIQYGGSVKPENAEDLLSQLNIDGALVGGASLDPHQFAAIVRAAARAMKHA
ncbi:MAG: triose-phosphate isomerase [Candidatus Fraserbacteria bacterium RBG_16_55_9]|uniref:Triosephosphate isomerase n=1 Tax=Fraserbacteria sp. (strain RBG_16_55_9) TaxID=1817864 RepID=A0A1F5V2V6_FRAXR|nr:MAG: triose-phosphate isomerase [Candidatus Fraserbacteria bacterium RBG_16_55_9]